MNKLKQYRPAFLKEEMRHRMDGENATYGCLECKTKLPPHLKYYCSGAHMQQAKENGTYKAD